MSAYNFIFKGKSRKVVGYGVPNTSGFLLPFISVTLATVLIGSVVGVFLLLLTGRAVPDALLGLIGAVVGYFGGCLISYANMPKEPPVKEEE